MPEYLLMHQTSPTSAQLIERFEDCQSVDTVIDYVIKYWPEDRESTLIVYRDSVLCAVITPIATGLVVTLVESPPVSVTDIHYVISDDGWIVATTFNRNGFRRIDHETH